jgi:hypothetical protein
VPGNDLLEFRDVVAQAIGADSRILDEGNRLGVTFFGHRQAERQRTEFPDLSLHLRIAGLEEMRASAKRFKIGLELQELGLGLVRVVCVELDDQNGGRVADEKAA